MQAAISGVYNVVNVTIGDNDGIKISLIANRKIDEKSLVNDILEGALETENVNAIIMKYHLFRVDVSTGAYDISICKNHLMMQMKDFTIDINQSVNKKLTDLISRDVFKVVDVVTAEGMSWYINGSGAMNHLLKIRFTTNNGTVLGYAGEFNHVCIEDTLLAKCLSSNAAPTVDVVQKIANETSDFASAEIVGILEDGTWQCVCYPIDGKKESVIKNIAV